MGDYNIIKITTIKKMVVYFFLLLSPIMIFFLILNQVINKI